MTIMGTRRKSADDYEQMTTEEFHDLIEGQLREMDKETLVDLLVEHAWSEISELLNNETLERWANMHDSEFGVPLDEECCPQCGVPLTEEERAAAADFESESDLCWCFACLATL